MIEQMFIGLPRPLTRFFAWLGGYFWLPCPMCGKMFAGYESGFGSKNGKILCWRCPNKMYNDQNEEVFIVYDPSYLKMQEGLFNAIQYKTKKQIDEENNVKRTSR